MYGETVTKLYKTSSNLSVCWEPIRGVRGLSISTLILYLLLVNIYLSLFVLQRCNSVRLPDPAVCFEMYLPADGLASPARSRKGAAACVSSLF